MPPKRALMRVYITDNDKADSVHTKSPLKRRANKTKVEIQFASPEYNVMENDGAAEAMVVRSGKPEGSVSIRFATFDETAVAGQDYVGTQGTLVFGPGETRKKVSVPIIDDAGIEPGRDGGGQQSLTRGIIKRFTIIQILPTISHLFASRRELLDQAPAPDHQGEGGRMCGWQEQRRTRVCAR